MKILFLILLFFMSSFASSKTITMGLYNNPPLSSIDPKTKEAKGLFVDILKNLSQKENLRLYFTPCKFNKCLELLKNKKIDILGPIAFSAKRAQNILFLNENVLSNWGVVYTRDNIHIKNLPDLKEKKIGVLKKDIYTNFFIHMAKEFQTDIHIVVYDSYDKIFKAIENKKIFAGIGGRLLTYSIKDKFPNIKESNIIFKPIGITFALNKQDAHLKETLDIALKNYKLDKNSHYYKILNQYLTIKTDKPYFKWIISTMLFLFFIVLLLMYINKLLNKRVKKATQKLTEAKNIIKKSLNNHIYLTSIIETVKNVNQILIENIEKKQKLNDICKKIIQNNLYSFCIISHIDKQGSVSVVGQSENKNIKENFIYLFEDTPVTQNVLLNTTYQDQITCTHNIEDIDFCSQMDKCHFSFSISAPIYIDKKLTHIITVFSINHKGFKDKEIALVNELSGDIGLWLTLEKHKREKEDSYEQIIISLNKTVEARDPYTAGHDERVQFYSIKIAQALNICDADIKLLEKSALIHDIGKIKIPDAILLKPAKLTEVEYEIVKEHPKAAYDMLQGVSFLKDELDIILHHHERYDGTGYPDGLKGDKIPLLSQILSIADTFDAMTTNRIYKQAKSKENAIEELKTLKNTSFSSKIVDVAVECFKHLDLVNNIYQMPINALEEARFSYFFKDNSTNCYNKNFLLYLFMENEIKNYNYIYTVDLKNFTAYNHVFGWENGDQFLVAFSKLLFKKFHTDKIFRVKGDDFIILAKEDVYISEADILENRLFSNGIAKIGISKTEMSKIKNIDDIKDIIRKL